jgi:hypothetical protein
MKKLTPDETHALIVLSKYSSYCPGLGTEDEVRAVRKALDSLVRKGRASIIEVADEGPVYRVAASAIREARELAEAAL